MKEYELFYLIGETKKSEFRTIDKDVHVIAKKYGAELTGKQVTEERRLAYIINHERHGLYVAQRFTISNPGNDPIAKIQRELSLHDGVLRALIVNAENLPPLLSKEEREAEHIIQKQKEEIKEDKKADNVEIDKQVEKALHL